MIEKESMMIIFLQYLIDTNLQRVHMKPTMVENLTAYYRAAENIINCSGLREKVIHAFRTLDCLKCMNFEIKKVEIEVEEDVVQYSEDCKDAAGLECLLEAKGKGSRAA